MKRRLRIFLFLLVLIPELIVAQASSAKRTWIFFRSKEISNLHNINPSKIGISERALKRRAKTLPPDRLIDELDIPVSKSSMEQVERTGARIHSISRWFNAVSVEATREQLQMLNTLPIVSKMKPVATLKHSEPSPSETIQTHLLKQELSTAGLVYGYSASQLNNIKIVDLHNLGVNGLGVLIGMLDDGFNNFRIHEALKNVHVVADSDFIHNISDVNRQQWESTSQGDHGAGTFSAAGGLANGHMVGAAFSSSFILAKTEMDSSGGLDFNSEEDTYVAALEWMERLGADITSSSLGYKEFRGLPSYVTSDMDGRTTKVAQAAVIASRKGILVVTSMGNEGDIIAGLHIDSTLASPADADSIIAVGAAYSNGILADFSSCGPTADGRIKPDVIAQGVSVYWAYGGSTSGYAVKNGTSCSAPLVAGAAALVLSVHPQLSNMQVREAILNTSRQINDGTVQTLTYPNNYYGYGFVNALDAALSCGPVFSNRLLIVAVDSTYHISVWIRHTDSPLMSSVYLHYKSLSGSAFQQTELLHINSYEYVGTLPLSFLDSTSVGFITAYDQYGVKYCSPYDTSVSLYSLACTADSLLNNFPENVIPSEYLLHQNYPNPFNDRTTILFDSPSYKEVEISIFNVLGQHIKTVFHGEVFPGRNVNYWTGVDEQGHQVASGVYFVRMKTPSLVQSKKILYIR